jgi:hypothetical protein
LLPPLLEISEIAARLRLIFPEGTANRNYLVRDLGVRTVFTMLYIGAIEPERWAGPKHVYCMSDEQSRKDSDAERNEYAVKCIGKKFVPLPGRWYADNSRESIRDESLREGLVPVGAVIVKAGIPTTSSKPRYGLHPSFAKLLEPSLVGDELTREIEEWQKKFLSAGALARIQLVSRGASASHSGIRIELPSGESRIMSAGKSSVITKAVVEVFAPRFLAAPAVVWISESGNKVIERDDQLAKSIGIEIDAAKVLPDVILADVGTPFLLVFVEVVHSDGPISLDRRLALMDIAIKANLPADQVAFVTAFEDRSSTAFRKAMSNLAWGSFAWCASEPNSIIAFDGREPQSAVSLRSYP